MITEEFIERRNKLTFQMVGEIKSVIEHIKEQNKDVSILEVFGIYAMVQGVVLSGIYNDLGKLKCAPDKWFDIFMATFISSLPDEKYTYVFTRIMKDEEKKNANAI